MIEPREYQKAAHDAVMSAKARGARKALVEMATGTGKTVVGVFCAQTVGGSVLVLAHREELLNQWEETFRVMAPEWTVGRVKAQKNELGYRVTLASIDTVRNRERLLDLVNAGPYDIVIDDEAHHSVSATHLKVLRAIDTGDNLFLGLTATPGRLDNKPLKLAWDEIVYRYDIVQAIAEGWLVDVEGWTARLKIDFDEVEVSKDGDFNEKSLSALMSSEKVVKETIKAWREKAAGKKTAIFSVDVAHGKALAEEMTACGFPAANIHGELSSKDRRPLYDAFRSGSLVGLTSCGVLTEGWDEKSVECILLARPTMSAGLYVQMVGRGTRPFPGKDKCVVIDVVGNSSRHSLMQLGMLTGLPPSSLEAQPSIRKADVHQAPPPDSIRSFQAHAAKARNVDLVEGALRLRKYDWLDSHWGQVMDLGASENGYLLIRKLPESIGLYRIVHIFLERGWRLGYEILQDNISFNWAMGLAEQKGRQVLGGGKKDGWKKNDAEWRGLPPTEPQMNRIRKLGLQCNPRTRADAAKVLTEADFRSIMGAFGAEAKTEEGNRIRGHLKQILKDPNGFLPRFGVTTREQIDEMRDEEARRLRALAFKMQKDHEREAGF